MGSDREGFGSDGGLTRDGAVVRILVTEQAAARHADAIAEALQGRPHRLVHAGDADIAFVSRDVTGMSTKHEIAPATAVFYDAMRQAGSLRWVHTHAAGADRPIFIELRARGVVLTTSSGANAEVVAQSTVAGLLALARRFPELMAAQRQRRWASLIGGVQPRDLAGQRATIVGWGPIGQHVARMLAVFGLEIAVVRSSATPAGAGMRTVAFEQIAELLPGTDWLILACPLSARTEGFIDAAALALLPRGAHLLNVSRGEVMDEAALILALQEGALAGAFLDVFTHEPLAVESPLWGMGNVIATPHSAGFSDGNAARVASMFLDNLRRWGVGEALLRRVV